MNAVFVRGRRFYLAAEGIRGPEQAEYKHKFITERRLATIRHIEHKQENREGTKKNRNCDSTWMDRINRIKKRPNLNTKFTKFINRKFTKLPPKNFVFFSFSTL